VSSLPPDQLAALVEAVQRLLATESSEAHVRRTMETPAGYDPALWKQLAEMGLPGLAIEEAHGGAGAGAVELEAVMEAAGAALLCAPLLGGVLAAEVLRASGDAAAQARLLPGIADGSTLATAAFTGDAGTWTRDGVAVAATASGGGSASATLAGVASYVLHGQNAHVLLVLARAGNGLAWYEVDPHAPGVAIGPLPTFDHTLRLARIAFDGAPGRRIVGDGWHAARAALDLGLVALAGEQAGGARRVLDFTVDYAKNRFQFGRAIGSFQAIKHMAADLLLEAESALSAARHAAAQLAAGAPDAREALHLAAFACADAFVQVAATSIQMHGGIAFTWMHPAHLYLRRARASAQLLGSSAAHRESYLAALGG
jgi:alkylation response protein AidB-like acyl-CoA dehydrogenase